MRRLFRKLRQSLRVASLGASAWQKVWLFALSFWISLRAHLKWPARSFHIRLQYRGKQFPFIIERMSDFAALREVFLDEEYDVPEMLQPSVIIDVGSNVGASVCYFAIRFPQARIIAIEPDPRAFHQLQKNTKDLQGVTLVQRAIAGKSGEMTLYIQKHGTMGSSLQERKHSTEKVMVRTETLEGIMRTQGVNRINLLKFDVEGAEEHLFQSRDDLSGIDTIIGEVHLDLITISKPGFLRRFEGFDLETRPINDQRFIVYARRQ